MRWVIFSVLALLATATAPTPVRAHPHVFVEVGVKFEFDDADALAGIEVTWTYDALFSLLILSDRGLDPDADMILTEDEKDALLGFDLLDWPEGFEGALFAEAPAARLRFAAPIALSVAMDADRLVTRHFRPIDGPPIPIEQLAVKPYDPSYYAALTLGENIALPAQCSYEVVSPDKDAADAQVAKLGNANDEMLFEEVEVGIYYAETVLVTCASPS